jgi:hypothetical protein
MFSPSHDGVFTKISVLGAPKASCRISTKSASTTSPLTWKQTRTARTIPRRAHLTLAVHAAAHPRRTVKIAIAVAPRHVVPTPQFRQGILCATTATNSATTRKTARRNANFALQKLTLRTHARTSPTKEPSPPNTKETIATIVTPTTRVAIVRAPQKTNEGLDHWRCHHHTCI